MRYLACISLAFLLRRDAPASHPIHTTFTEVVQSRTRGPVTITMRGFADDLATAGHGGQRLGSLDSAIVHYLQRRIVLTDGQGRPIPFKLREIRRTPDVLWFTFQSMSAGDLRGARLTHSVLTELHADQVNLVQVKIGERARTLLFTAGDGAKRIGG